MISSPLSFVNLGCCGVPHLVSFDAEADNLDFSSSNLSMSRSTSICSDSALLNSLLEIALFISSLYLFN